MATWIEDVTQALRDLGGVASLSDIYEVVARLRTEPLPPSWEAIVRSTRSGSGLSSGPTSQSSSPRTSSS